MCWYPVNFLAEEQVRLWECEESVFRSKLHVEMPMKKIIIVHMLPFNYALSCKEPGFN